MRHSLSELVKSRRGARAARALLAATLLALPAGAGATLPFGEALPLEGLGAAKEGEWAEYVTLVGGEAVGPWIRFLAGPREAGGRWIEVWISSRPGSATQAFRLLLDPAAPGGVARLRGRMLGGPIRDLPLEPAAVRVGGPSAWSTQGMESIQTGLGTLRARRAELRRGGRVAATAWMDASLPVLGLARLELASGAGLEIHAWGRAGRSVIDD